MAIIPEQQVQTSTLRGVDPTQFLQQAYREQQANVAAFNQMNTAIQQEAQKFIQKQEEKKQKEMTYSAILPYIQQMSGGDAKQADALAKQIASNPASSSAILNMVQMSQEQEAKAADQAALQQALAVSTTPGGEIDYASVLPSYIELGGRDVERVSGLVDEQTSKQLFEPEIIEIDGVKAIRTSKGQVQVLDIPADDPFEPTVTEIDGVTFAETAPNKWKVVEKDPSAPEPVIKELTDSKGDTYTVITVGGSSRIFQSEGPPIVVGDKGGDETKGDSLGLGL